MSYLEGWRSVCLSPVPSRIIRRFCFSTNQVQAWIRKAGLAMWESIRGLKDQGITVLMTTHYMEEAEALCDRVAIIDHGKILVEDTPEQLKSGLGIQTVYGLDIQRLDKREELASNLRAVPLVSSVETTPTGVRVYTQGAEGLLSTIVTAAQAYGLRDISISEPSLETVFIHLTGRELRE